MADVIFNGFIDVLMISLSIVWLSVTAPFSSDYRFRCKLDNVLNVRYKLLEALPEITKLS